MPATTLSRRKLSSKEALASIGRQSSSRWEQPVLRDRNNQKQKARKQVIQGAGFVSLVPFRGPLLYLSRCLPLSVGSAFSCSNLS